VSAADQPKSFVSTGPGAAEYLLYKDVYRDGS
jgi:glyoxylate utilization-related uncharacterized protein